MLLNILFACTSIKVIYVYSLNSIFRVGKGNVSYVKMNKICMYEIVTLSWYDIYFFELFNVKNSNVLYKNSYIKLLYKVTNDI